jgi:succinoglycan biosynthesis transport protein ExoP
LSGQSSLEAAILADPTTKLSFLPAIIPEKIAYTSELLSSVPMAQLLERLRRDYDWIVLDLSPLAPVIDVRATSQITDAYVLVIEWGGTEIDVVDRALRDAPMVRERIIGAVLNKADMNVLSRYESCRGYYCNQYYQKYGYVD